MYYGSYFSPIIGRPPSPPPNIGPPQPNIDRTPHSGGGLLGVSRRFYFNKNFQINESYTLMSIYQTKQIELNN